MDSIRAHQWRGSAQARFSVTRCRAASAAPATPGIRSTQLTTTRQGLDLVIVPSKMSWLCVTQTEGQSAAVPVSCDRLQILIQKKANSHADWRFRSSCSFRSRWTTGGGFSSDF